jgi:GDPmannose 4,6-dehydratase
MTTHKVLITGVTGFAGSYLAHRLIENGNDVVGLFSRRADSRKPQHLIDSGILHRIQLINGDITDLTSVLSAIQQAQPDWMFHFAAQTFIPQSFNDPLGTFRVNCQGTQNVLEAIRLKDFEIRAIFAGSSEEYGLQFKNVDHFKKMKDKYGVIEPEPKVFPELPVDEDSFLRPMSPYATSKVYGDYAFRNYHNTYGLDTVVSRAFNHEGARRGHNFVTSSIVSQLVTMHLNEGKTMRIGDIQAFRDWSHVEDIVDGYILLAEKGSAGSVYVQGSKRTNSVLSYILYTIEALGYEIHEIRTTNNDKKVNDPLALADLNIGKIALKSNKVDSMLMNGTLEFNMEYQGLIIDTNKRPFKLEFDPTRFRPSDVPILLSNIDRIKRLGFAPTRQLIDIIEDQINYYLDPEHRKMVLSQ